MQDLSTAPFQYRGPPAEETTTFSVFIRHRAGEFCGGRSRLQNEVDHGDAWWRLQKEQGVRTEQRGD